MKFKLPVLAAALAVCGGFLLPAQTTTTTTKKTASSSTSGGDLFEINLFGGGVFPKRQNDPPNQQGVSGGVGGFRVVENIWNYVSLEQTGMVHGVSNLRYRIPGTNQDYGLGARLRQFHFNPVLHFQPREARVRAFVTMGFGFDYFGITDDARRSVGTGVNTPFRQTVNLESSFKPAFNYGGGVKAKLTDRIGVRFDIRGFATASPDFGVPTGGPAGAIVYTRTTPLNSLQTTGGVTFYLGAINTGPVCEFRVGTIDPSSRTVWQGEGASFQLPVTNTCLGVTPKYAWTIDGAPVTGDAMASFSETKPGDHQIKAVVSADASKVTDRRTRNELKKVPIPATERTATLTVKQPKIDLVSATVDPSTINYNGTARVTSVVSFDGPPAGQEVTVVYKASDGKMSSPSGKVSPDGRTVENKVMLKPGNTTDTATFSAEGITIQPGGPSKKVDIEVSVLDQNGNVLAKVSPPGGGVNISAPPAPAPVAAPAPPQAQPMQLDDVVFGKGSARVNNCGKRILDQAFERAASMGDYDVLLVGHYDAVEKNLKVRDAKTRKTRALDEERVLQVAAVLSAGVEPCKRLERGRIKVAMVGAEQLSAFKTSLCEATVKERRTGRITAADGSAKNRRVEIWLVPKGGPMPNGIGGIQDAPQSDIESKGCPK